MDGSNPKGCFSKHDKLTPHNTDLYPGPRKWQIWLDMSETMLTCKLNRNTIKKDYVET